MSRKAFWIILALAICLNAYLHVRLLALNNFYFTVDQGKDALFVREILERHIVLKGPVTSVAGVHAGVLWFYFIAIGYAIFNGHPYGAPFMELLLNSFVIIFLACYLQVRIGKARALLVSLSLLFSWQFFETTAWGFNPFPLAALATLQAMYLTEFLGRKPKAYLIALIPTMLAFHAEIAGATNLLIFYIFIGGVGVHRKMISLKKYVLFAFVVPLLFSISLLYELVKRLQFVQTIYNGDSAGLGTFAKSNFGPVGVNFGQIIGSAVLRQYWPIGLVAIGIVTYFYFQQKHERSKFESRLTFVSGSLVAISYMFFGSNNGWRDWQTVFFFPIVYVWFMTIGTSLATGEGWRKKLIWLSLAIVIGLKVQTFISRYTLYPNPKKDTSVLTNELATLDWIYTHSEHDGFNAYVYTDRFYDYTYQYLFWWYGRSKYGFMPCEYANYPHAPKETYVPNYLSYSEPRLGCDKFRFLIVQSDTNGEPNEDWIKDFRASTKLIEEADIGDTHVEKRAVN